MAHSRKGSVQAVTLADGTLHYRLRFFAAGERQSAYLHEGRDCECGCGGGYTDRTARVELGNILARVDAGVWKPPTPTAKVAELAGMPTFHEYASRWLAGKQTGLIGERPIDQSTYQDYLWRLRRHLLPYFASYRLDEIDRTACLAFKQHKLEQTADTRNALDAGADLRDLRGRRQVPLGPASIKKLIDALKAILDEAVEDGHIPTNPARSPRMRVHVPKPKRTFLEVDELTAIEDAAKAQDPKPSAALIAAARAQPDTTVARVARLALAGARPSQIAADLGLHLATVGYHLRNLDTTGATDYRARHAITSTLSRCGVRVGELCDMQIGHLRLHDPGGARLRIPDSKTPAGIREVQVTPDLAHTLARHLGLMAQAGYPTGPEAFLFCNRRGHQLTRQRVSQLLRHATTAATEHQQQLGLPPLPITTPHTLRRTYISIALLANNFDVLWVMRQVGHADSKMTLEVYAQLQQRTKRDHGHAFDALLLDARSQPQPELEHTS